MPRPDHPAFDPEVLADLWKLGSVEKTPYLMALAAAQRGLKVTFWGSSVAARIPSSFPILSPDRPSLFTVEDGPRRHVFDKTQGVRLPRSVRLLCRNKEDTKRVLRKAGILVPDGILFDPGNKARLLTFLAGTGAEHFIAKPVAGSRSRGVTKGITRDQLLRARQRKNSPRYMIEEQIVGREYRVYVVDGRVTGAYLRPVPVVVGNGRDTIRALIARRNEHRAKTLHYAGRPIELPRVAAFLARSGKSVNDIPVLGERVRLGESHKKNEGGSVVEATLAISRNAAETAIRTCEALGLPHGGIDLIERGDEVFVLEANVRAMIDNHSFPETGTGSANLVAEAIIDFYFPPKEGQVRNPAIRIDCEAIRAAFASGSETTRHEVRVI